MDFTKLNIEFANMQNTINKYKNISNEIKNKIRNNLKDINKYETKIKSIQNSLEKESYKMIVSALKNETAFLEILIKEDEINEQQKGTVKPI